MSEKKISNTLHSNMVDLILMTVRENELKILLLRRKNLIPKGWALPGGYLSQEEDMDEYVRKELELATQITDRTYFRQLYTLGNADRSPDERVISTVYLSLTPDSNIRPHYDNAAESAWFRITKKVLSMDSFERRSILELTSDDKSIRMQYKIVDTARSNYIETRSVLREDSNSKLAADYIKVINMAMDLVQHRAAGTGILFNLLPEECTLREIQTAYEAIVGYKTDTGNFRRDIRKMLMDTGRKKKINGRSAELYSFNPMYCYLEENL